MREFVENPNPPYLLMVNREFLLRNCDKNRADEAKFACRSVFDNFFSTDGGGE